MDRCYRKAFADEVALHMLSAQHGKAFDPRIVDIFLAHSADIIATRDRVNQNHPSYSDLVAGR
jgi:putative two-component system response regulator